MKKLPFVLSILLLGSFASPAPAKPIGEAGQARASAGTSYVIGAAGDIACPSAPYPATRPDNCQYDDTAKMLAGLTLVLALGDNQYNTGSYSAYTSYYDPTWGRYLANTNPVPGNHEYAQDPSSTPSGYFRYFGDRVRGPDGLGYYSFDVPKGCTPGQGVCWHFIALSSELCFADYPHAHDVLLHRREGLDRALAEIAKDCPFTPLVGRLRCLRGVDTLTALGLCAEVSDFGRFPGPEALAAYLGLVPPESSSGERRRQGSITKAGSSHARRPLVEAAHHYCRPPRVGKQPRLRQEGQPAWVIETAWRRQRRLYGRRQRLRLERGKRGGVVIIAIARELAGYCWELAATDRG